MPAPCRPYEISLCIIPLTGERHKRGLGVSCPTWRHCVSYRQETVCEGFPARLGSTVFLIGRKLFAKGFLLDVALWCFLPAGNFSPIVSYSTWHCGVSYRQETFRQEISRLRFATLEMTEARGSTVFLTGRKLFAKGFLLGVAPLCFLPAGNFLRRVSCSAWLHCVSCRQETVCEGFPARRDTVAFLTGRKLFTYSFLLDLALWCFLPTGNYLRRVSCSTWLHCVSYRQETVCEGFPTRRGSIVFLADRKLFAYSFLLGMAPLCFLSTGNYSRRVSCSTWLHCVSCRQETVCEGFPTRRGSTVFLADRKLFAKGFLLGVAPLCFLPAGNCLRRVSYSAWLHCVSCRQETFRWEISRLRFATLEMTEERGTSMFHTVQ